MPAQDDPAERVLDALGNAVRREIVAMLAERPHSVAEIAAAFPISRPAISRHLSLLSRAGLIRYRAMGTRNIYELEALGFAHAALWMREMAETAQENEKPAIHKDSGLSRSA